MRRQRTRAFAFILYIALYITAALPMCLCTTRPLIEFALFESSNGTVYGHFGLARPQTVDGDVRFEREPSSGRYEISVNVNEPCHHFVRGSALVTSTDDGSIRVVSSINSSLSIAIDSDTRFAGSRRDFRVINNSTMVTSSGLRAEYVLDASYAPDKCPWIRLSHNVTTQPRDVVNFSSNVTETCFEHNSSLLAINVTLDSLLNPLVNLDLQQVWIYNDQDGWESMNLTNPLVDINVAAEWVNSREHSSHIKTASFVSKLLPWLPSFNINYSNTPDNPIELLFTIFYSVLDKYGHKHDEL